MFLNIREIHDSCDSRILQKSDSNPNDDSSPKWRDPYQRFIDATTQLRVNGWSSYAAWSMDDGIKMSVLS